MNYKKILEIAENIVRDNTFDGDYPTLVYPLPIHYLKLLDKELFISMNVDDNEFTPQSIIHFNIDGIKFIFYEKDSIEMEFNKML